MPQRRFDAFVSAVTNECGKARDAVAAELRKQGLTVSVQSDFEHLPASFTTLRKLHDYIRNCAEVHCLIGTRSGGCPPPDAAAEFERFLPKGVTEASYTQWEYFFAARYVPEHLWLYIASDNYHPDEATPAGPDDPDLQRDFLAYLRRRRGLDYAPFDTIDGVRAAVLSHRPEPSEQAHPAQTVTPFHHNVAANAIGSTIAGVFVAVLI